MKKIAKIMTAFVLMITIMMHICACGTIGDLSKDVKKNPVTGKEADEAFTASQLDFAVKLFQNSMAEKGENTLVSPLSVMSALAMTANGAAGETLSQMETMLGGALFIDQLNEYLHTYVENLPSEEKAAFHLANSIWVDEPEITVTEDFLQKNADYYGASVFSERFDGNETRDRINAWVEENTHGMIKNILNEVPEAAVMFLVNALTFEAEWAVPFEKYAIREEEFTAASGEKQLVDMMRSEENIYLEDKNTTGFVKRYEGGYSFVALLPDEDLSIEEYVAGLTGEKLGKLLNNPTYTDVNIKMPKFEHEYDIGMNDILKKMGMTDAFDAMTADFSAMGESERGNIFVSRVIHKTFITVDNLSTKAGAATVVQMDAEGAIINPKEPKTVYLDRPFVYMIVDNETNLPIFIGAVTSIEK